MMSSHELVEKAFGGERGMDSLEVRSSLWQT